MIARGTNASVQVNRTHNESNLNERRGSLGNIVKCGNSCDCCDTMPSAFHLAAGAASGVLAGLAVGVISAAATDFNQNASMGVGLGFTVGGLLGLGAAILRRCSVYKSQCCNPPDVEIGTAQSQNVRVRAVKQTSSHDVEMGAVQPESMLLAPTGLNQHADKSSSHSDSTQEERALLQKVHPETPLSVGGLYRPSGRTNKNRMSRQRLEPIKEAPKESSSQESSQTSIHTLKETQK